MIGQGFTFLVAGYETSSNTTTMASYLLATHPAAQQRMADEIDAVLGPWRAGAGAGEGACAGGELTPELLAKVGWWVWVGVTAQGRKYAVLCERCGATFAVLPCACMCGCVGVWACGRGRAWKRFAAGA